MKEILEALRGPALGVVFMIILFGGVVVITAFAALIAQVGLLLRLRPQQVVSPQSDSERQRETLSQRYQARRRILGGRFRP
jgi:hypothetical protein